MYVAHLYLVWAVVMGVWLGAVLLAGAVCRAHAIDLLVSSINRVSAS